MKAKKHSHKFILTGKLARTPVILKSARQCVVYLDFKHHQIVNMPFNSRIFLLPGLYNSGPEHWQTHWERKYGFTRINQSDWETPVCDTWTATIEDTLADQPLEEVLLVGHSLACSTIVHWAKRYNHTIRGAMLVGPSDVEAPSYPPGTTGFYPMPLFKLNFPSVVIASSNDEYVTLDRAGFFANAWGSQLINAGPLGHINSASGLGDWPAGIEWLKKLDH